MDNLRTNLIETLSTSMTAREAAVAALARPRPVFGSRQEVRSHASFALHDALPRLPPKGIVGPHEVVGGLRDLEPPLLARGLHPAGGVHRVAKEAVPWEIASEGAACGWCFHTHARSALPEPGPVSLSVPVLALR